MMQFVSNTGGGIPVDLETAILDGFASDGGLYVPSELPKISLEQLKKWRDLAYVDLAFEILSLFINRSVISEFELKKLLKDAYTPFEKPEVIPLYKMESQKDIHIMELFYGPTISFKDVGLAFLVNLVDFFLKRKNEFKSLIVATTGDTGPATAYFTAGKSNLSAWVLYPKGLITEEQERQMTTLTHSNIHPVGVSNCLDGGDDLDLVIANLYANIQFKEKVHLSSVNSINWGRVMMQTVHYFYGYLKVVETIGEEINMSVPSGAFGNLCAGGLARKMGLPIDKYVIANNTNACLHRIFSEGVFSKQPIFETPSSAIDILIPYNFWRFLYFCVDEDATKIKKWSDEFKTFGKVEFDKETLAAYSEGFLTASISDERTLEVIKEVYTTENYLLDPHGAVALAAVHDLKDILGDKKLVCLATAHPAKFPQVMKDALQVKTISEKGKHPSIEKAKTLREKVYLIDCYHLEEELLCRMNADWDLKHNTHN
ncbi:threonine synthase [Maribacter algarum]|uniref:Threonine synthase n=1 Tax=Maribacter algarum (ex Zhang et al. 2020) TaxID=2578118 RepID=A0A5S3PRQ8_9FLAO|nr:threonine synthase [Maribacter algarum]TMM57319.1 threonine synthase [Maribacter algarum]